MAPATPGMMRGIIGTDTPGMTLLDAREKVKKEKGSESEKEKEKLEEKDMKEKENRDNGVNVKRKRLIEMPSS